MPVLFLILTQKLISAGNICDDFGIDKVGLSAETPDKKCNDIASLPIGSSHFDAAITIIFGIDFSICIEKLEFLRVKWVQLNPWIVDCIF